jgi:hypothetical protein
MARWARAALLALLLASCSAWLDLDPGRLDGASDASEETTADSTEDTGTEDSSVPDVSDVPDTDAGDPDAADAAEDVEDDCTETGDCTEHGDCDDGDPCTTDTCEPVCGVCSHVPGDEPAIVRASTTLNPFLAARNSAPAQVWTGSEFGVAWSLWYVTSSAEIGFQRVAADGALVGAASVVSDGTTDVGEVGVAWTGSEFGVAWVYLGPGFDVHFRKLHGDGSIASGIIPVSSGSGGCQLPHMAWTGSYFGVAYSQWATSRSEIMYSPRRLDGSAAMGTTTVTSSGDDSTAPELVWTGSEYGLAWRDNRNDSDTSDGDMIYDAMFMRLGEDGTDITSPIAVSPAGTQWAGAPTIVWTGSEFGVLWSDNEDLSTELYLGRVSPDGSEIGSEALMGTFSGVYAPSLVWTGSYFVATWTGSSGNTIDLMTFDALGGSAGTVVTVASTMTGQNGNVVWTGSEAGVTWASDGYAHHARVRICEVP